MTAPSAVTVWSPGRGCSVAVTIRPWVGSWPLMRSPMLSDPPCWVAMSLTIVLAFSVRVSMMLLLRRLLAGPSTLPGLAPRCKPGVSRPGERRTPSGVAAVAPQPVGHQAEADTEHPDVLGDADPLRRRPDAAGLVERVGPQVHGDQGAREARESGAGDGRRYERRQQ